MDSFLGVPVTVKGQVVGRLYLTNKQGAAEFGADDQALVETFALHAGIAIENARLHEQVQRLAVVDERDRISRDLHDSVIQMIYASDALARRRARPCQTSACRGGSRRVDGAIDALHDVIRDIRHFIFGLRPCCWTRAACVDGLNALADEMRRNTTTEVQVIG